MDLVNKFWNFCHTLRHEGVDYSDYIEELTYLLFLKIADERAVDIPKGCNWSDLIIFNQEDLLIKYNQILAELSKEKNILGDIFSQPLAKIRNSASLKRLLVLIDEINWSNYNEDVLGAMFEGLLEKAANESKKGAGQYFTPRPLIEAIVKVMKPDPFENPNFKVSDVACGTAGFIISSYEWWKANNSKTILSNDQKSKLFNETYYGQELVIRPRRMAQMNLYLHGIEPNIVLGDTIYEPLQPNYFTCILTNPPFGNKGANQIPDRSDFKIKTSNKQLNFIQHIFSCLEDKGRAAVVLPDSVLTDDKAMDLWRHLMPQCNIHTILKLPHGTFLPYTNVKANVIFLQKGLPTDNVWFFDARSNVESITKKGRPLATKHFKEFVDCYGQNPNGTGKRKDLGELGRFRSYTIDQIKERNYNLDVSWLKDDNAEDFTNLPDPLILLSTLITELDTLVDELKDISQILEESDGE